MLKKRSSLLIILFLIITTGVSLLVLQGQITKETSKLKPSPTKPKETRSDIRETFPIVEYSNNPLLENEIRKSEKYDTGQRILFPEILEDTEGFSTLHWDKGLTALPVRKSDVVILGRVVDAKAHLSAKKNLFTPNSK